MKLFSSNGALHSEKSGCGRIFLLYPTCIFIEIDQRQPTCPEMGKMVAFSPHPQEVNLSKGNYRTRKWKNWLPPVILINLFEKRKDN